MAEFSNLVNTDISTTPFQLVVFGKGAPLLEVELNEMQYLSYERMKVYFKEFVGNKMNGSITYADSKLNINATFCICGYLFKCNDVEVDASTNTKYYINVSMGDVSPSSTVRKYGYVDGEILKNTLIDERVGFESSHRKAMEFSITTTQDTSAEGSIPLCSIGSDGSVTNLISEDLLDNLARSISTLNAKINDLNTKISSFPNLCIYSYSQSTFSLDADQSKSWRYNYGVGEEIISVLPVYNCYNNTLLVTAPRTEILEDGRTSLIVWTKNSGTLTVSDIAMSLTVLTRKI